MKVFLMRHAHADYGPPDPERVLSDRGLACARGIADFARERAFFDFEEIWSSPYERARQTAEPFAAGMENTPEIRYMDMLVPHGDPVELLRKLKTVSQNLLIVGHNPHLSILARYLIGSDHEQAHLPFKKGALMVFKQDSFSESGYSLQAYLTPSSLGL